MPFAYKTTILIEFSVAFVKSAIPYLRETKGNVIMTSSGAASNGYGSWGAYGSSKAAMNHLAMTLAAEEKVCLQLSPSEFFPAIPTKLSTPCLLDIH